MGVLDVVKAGVLSGDDVTRLYKYAKEQGFAIPAVNVVGSDSVNAVLEAAKTANSPVIIQFSNGGAGFYAGKACGNADVLGAVAGAQHVNLAANTKRLTACRFLVRICLILAKRAWRKI